MFVWSFVFAFFLQNSVSGLVWSGLVWSVCFGLLVWSGLAWSVWSGLVCLPSLPGLAWLPGCLAWPASLPAALLLCLCLSLWDVFYSQAVCQDRINLKAE